MSTPTPSPAAAAVEKIVRECADNILRDYHVKELGCRSWMPLQPMQSYASRDMARFPELPPERIAAYVNRAIADAIAALQVREALENANQTCRSAYAITSRKGVETNWETFERVLRLELLAQRQALANLDAVMGKEMK